MVNKNYRELIDGFNSFENYQNGFISLSQEKNEHFFWATAIEEDTQESYNRYLDKYPNGSSVEEAKKRLEELEIEADRKAWEKAIKNNTQNSYNTYLKVFRNGMYKDKAKIKIDEFIELKRKKELEKRRLKEIQFQKHEEESDKEAWEKAKKLNNKNSYRTYLKNYSNGIYRSEAKVKIDEFIRVEKERLLEEQRFKDFQIQKDEEELDRNAWDEALTQNHKSSYQLYLLKFPEGNFTEEAKKRIELLILLDKELKKKRKIKYGILFFLNFVLITFFSVKYFEFSLLEPTDIGGIVLLSFITYIFIFGFYDSIESSEVLQSQKKQYSDILITYKNIGVIFSVVVLFIISTYSMGSINGILLTLSYFFVTTFTYLLLDDKAPLILFFVLMIGKYIILSYFLTIIQASIIISIPFLFVFTGMLYFKLKIKNNH